MLKFFRPSSLLVSLSVFILVLTLSLAYFVLNTVDKLYLEANNINNAGYIRGGIQRLSKLVIAQPAESQLAIEAEIDYLFKDIEELASKRHESSSEKRFQLAVVSLKDDWLQLKVLIHSFRSSQSETIKQQILTLSEVCWSKANDIVYMMQSMTELKVQRISRLFYFVILLNVISAIVVIVIILLAVRNKLEYDTSHDPLTGLLNRRAYDLAIASEIARFTRYDVPVSLILFDVDFFKRINDKYGHKVGDSVLKQLANQVLSSVRNIDSVYRVGGEEFAIVCPDTSAKGAHQLSEKIRKIIEQSEFDVVGQVTISLGVAQFGGLLNADSFYQNADKALYLAKNNGRNQSRLYE